MTKKVQIIPKYKMFLKIDYPQHVVYSLSKKERVARKWRLLSWWGGRYYFFTTNRMVCVLVPCTNCTKYVSGFSADVLISV